MKRTIAALLCMMLGTGCATAYSLVEPRRAPIGDLYTVEPQIPWSAAKAGKMELWTVDGPALQAIRFINGLTDGDALFGGRDKEKRPKFRKAMTPTEIMEFVVDSLASSGLQKVEATNLRPEPFGDVPGFRFEMRFVYGGGLEGQGLVVGAVAKEKLYLIMYTGARAHYYAKHEEDVERLVRSVRMQ